MLLTSALVAMLASAAPAPQVLPSAQIRQSVEAALGERLRAQGSTARVAVAGRIEDVALPAGTWSTHVGDIAGRWPRARAGVPVQLRVDGQVVRTLTVWVEAHDPQLVLTYAADYPVRSPATAIATASATVDLVCCAGRPVGAPGPAAGRTRHPVRAGQPVLQSDFEDAPLVQARQPVSIVATRGAIRIETAGVAIGEGNLGERIAVRAPHSQTAITARVVAAGKVEVDDE